MLCSNVILKSSDVFPGKKNGYASDAALMPEPEGAAGSSASTDTAVQKCGS